jgi:hypothetical protein
MHDRGVGHVADDHVRAPLRGPHPTGARHHQDLHHHWRQRDHAPTHSRRLGHGAAPDLRVRDQGCSNKVVA